MENLQNIIESVLFVSGDAVAIKDISEKLNASNVQNQNANVDEKSFGGRVGEASDAVLKKYGICRICFRELAYKGQIPGVKKSSW